MNIEEIKTIVKLMADNDLSEFKIEAEEMHLCIRRGASSHAGIQSAPVVPVQPVIQTVQAAAPVAAAPAAAPAAPAKLDSAKVISSPIVGTFYRASSPDAEPFVKIGTKVTADSVVCIIEAMKVMNEIKAEKSGTIKEVLVENSQPIEYGQPLFVIE